MRGRGRARGSPDETPRAPAGTTPAGQVPDVAQVEPLVQAIKLLPADIRHALAVREGALSLSTTATYRHNKAKIDAFYEMCISPFILEQLRAEIEAVEW